MFFSEFLLALVIAAVLTIIFAVGFRRQGWGTGLFLFFFILFLATWAGGLWISPFEPLFYGVPLLSFLFVAIIIALLLTALTPPATRLPHPERQLKVKREAKSGTGTLAAADVILWILMLGLMVAVVAAYV
jgi:hypothetical protein